MSSLTPRLDKIQKNYLINGNMLIAQRGTSFAATADGTYGVDRFGYRKSGTMVHTVSQDNDVPSIVEANYLFVNSLRLNLTTPDTTIAATDLCSIQHFLEGYNWANLAQRVCTLSFWVKATLPGKYYVALRNAGPDRSCPLGYTIDAANTWEKKTIVIPASPAAGTWDYTNSIGLRIEWILAVGSDFHGSADVWQTGNFRAGADQINGVNTGATDFRITGVCLNEGEISDPGFSTFGGDFASELQACQRYYEKSYNIGVFPGGISGSGQGIFNNNDSAGTRNPFFYMSYKVNKRIGAPTAAIYNPTTGTISQARGSDGGNYTVDNLSAGQTGLFARIVSLPALTAGSVHFTVDAEL